MELQSAAAKAAVEELIEKYGAHNPAPYGTIGGKPVDIGGLQEGSRTIASAEPRAPEKA